eukprot:Phypoly_transcript_19550.p1 GENE.Phypoly_transcript_19550~~Phypoly_transcript_19550.p1  ORF type:complete len:179 (+),score=25.77 Phypoly_transcript_19550:125-661(+)
MAKSRWANYGKIFEKNGIIEPDSTWLVSFIGKGKYFSDDDLVQIKKCLDDLVANLIMHGENTDGKMTSKQWVAMGQDVAIGKSFDEAPDWILECGEALFNAFDKNKTGIIGENAFVDIITGMFPTRSFSATLCRAAYQQFQCDLDMPAYLEKFWGWASASSIQIEDVLLTVFLKIYGR